MPSCDPVCLAVRPQSFDWYRWFLIASFSNILLFVRAFTFYCRPLSHCLIFSCSTLFVHVRRMFVIFDIFPIVSYIPVNISLSFHSLTFAFRLSFITFKYIRASRQVLNTCRKITMRMHWGCGGQRAEGRARVLKFSEQSGIKRRRGSCRAMCGRACKTEGRENACVQCIARRARMRYEGWERTTKGRKGGEDNLPLLYARPVNNTPETPLLVVTKTFKPQCGVVPSRNSLVNKNRNNERKRFYQMR